MTDLRARAKELASTIQFCIFDEPGGRVLDVDGAIREFLAAFEAIRSEQIEADARIADVYADEEDVMAIEAVTDTEVAAYREGERTANQIAAAIRQAGEKKDGSRSSKTQAKPQLCEPRAALSSEADG